MRSGPGSSVFLCAFLSFTVSYGTVPASGAEGGTGGLLDGKVLLLEKGDEGAVADGKDVYIFRNGKFRSVSFEKHHGFGEGEYTSIRRKGTIAFSARIRNESQGTIRWEGTVKGDEVDVRYAWTGKKPKWYQLNPRATTHWARPVTAWVTEDPGPPGGGSPSKRLDGKTFLVESGEKGKEASHHNDYLVFRDGMFVSSDCLVLLEFRASTYSATEQEDGIRFQAETTSPTHGTMIWDGTVRGDVVDATARWVDKRWYWTIDRMYWFRGRLLE